MVLSPAARPLFSRLLSAVHSMVCCAFVGVVFLLMPATAWSAPTVMSQPTLQVEVGTHAGPVRRVVSDQRRDVVVTVSDDKTARVWRLSGPESTQSVQPGGSGGTSKRELLHTLRVPVGPGEQGRLYGAAIHPERDVVAVGGTSVQKKPGVPHAEVFLFELSTGKLVQRIDAGNAEIKRLAWSADGTLLIAGTASSAHNPAAVLAFDSTGRRVLTHSMRGSVFGLSVACSGLVVATDFSGALELFEASSAQMQPVQPVQHAGQRISLSGEKPVSVALSPDAQRAVVGYFSQTRPTVVNLVTGQPERELQLPDRDVDRGALMSVAWSQDGSTVYAAGAAARPGWQYTVWGFDAQSGASRSRVVAATDSINDLTALSDGSLLFASFDASWGRLRGDKVESSVVSAVSDLRGAEGLRADAQGKVVAWSARAGKGERRMNMNQRLVEQGVSARSSAQPATTLDGAVTKRGIFGRALQTSDQNGRLPYVMLGSTKVALGEGELAISSTHILNSEDALFGTSKALMRLGSDGRTLWRVTPGAEVNAVVSTRQGDLAITAHSDGSLRWWNAKNGTLVLTLISTQASTWVAWTPQGYFDASAGADRLVGWQLSHMDTGSTEFHTLARFRDRFNRPDIVDRALQTLDPEAAVTLAPAGEREAQFAAAGVQSTPAASATSLGPTAGKGFVVPPSLVLVSAPQLGGVPGGAPDSFQLRYALRSSAELGKLQLRVRLNGQLIGSDAVVELPTAYDGQAQGRIQLKAPAGGGDHAFG
jgi:WD40 repeat protein